MRPGEEWIPALHSLSTEELMSLRRAAADKRQGKVRKLTEHELAAHVRETDAEHLARWSNNRRVKTFLRFAKHFPATTIWGESNFQKLTT